MVLMVTYRGLIGHFIQHGMLMALIFCVCWLFDICILRLQFQMSLRRSARAKRPSARLAVRDEVAEPAASRRRLQDDVPPAEPAHSAPAVHQPPVAAPPAPPAPTLLPAEVLQSIVSAVTAEVSKNVAQLLACPPAAPTVQPATGASAVPVSGHSPLLGASTQPAPVPSSSIGVVHCLPATPSVAASTASANAIGAVCSSLTGESLLQQPSQPFQEASLPLDARVADKVKAKIWAGEFLDFASLLDTNLNNPTYHLAISHTSSDGSPSIHLEPSTKGSKISSIDSWFTAFHTFVAIYTAKFPSEAPSLMKYGEIVRDLAVRGHNWQFYDENFRYIKQSQALPWGSVHWELWLRSCSFGKAQSTVSPVPKKANNVSVPKGFCFKFHRGIPCAGCSFKHSCFKCGKNHRGSTCNFRAFTSNGGGKSTNDSVANSSKVKNLKVMLEGYDQVISDHLVNGFTVGFPIHFEGERSSYETDNLLSAFEHPDAVDQKLQKELSAHRISGPFTEPPFPDFRVSPLGVVPKKVPGEFRLIHHLSFPKGDSVNDGISSLDSAVQYARVDDAVKMVKAVGRNCFLAKTDIKNAFRIIPIHQSDHHLLGMKWRNLYYFDCCMPMGCSSSCKTFESFSTAVEWIAKEKLSIDSILHLLDDFLIGAPTRNLCQKRLDLFLRLCEFLGIPMAPEKTCGPAQILSFACLILF